ncbi:hypothetical protein C8R41DRAFT_738384, partial [Lentinula lateritia]
PILSYLAHHLLVQDMREICDQMICEWDGCVVLGVTQHVVNPLSIRPMTSPESLDTIALCSMSYRLNSFASDSKPPFVQIMVYFLHECNDRANRPWITQMFTNITGGKHQTDTDKMRKTAHPILQDCPVNPIDRKDTLNVMLNGRDPRKG